MYVHNTIPVHTVNHLQHFTKWMLTWQLESNVTILRRSLREEILLQQTHCLLSQLGYYI